jgi:hypothetical protein
MGRVCQLPWIRSGKWDAWIGRAVFINMPTHPHRDVGDWPFWTLVEAIFSPCGVNSGDEGTGKPSLFICRTQTFQEYKSNSTIVELISSQNKQTLCYP